MAGVADGSADGTAVTISSSPATDPGAVGPAGANLNEVLRRLLGRFDLTNQTADPAIGFLRRAIAWRADQDPIVKVVMTDNGIAHVSRDWARACGNDVLKVKHRRTAPYRPRTGGQAELVHPEAAARVGLRPALAV